MADKKVILEVEIIEGNAQSKLDSLNASLKSLDKTHKDYEPTLKLIAQAERDLSKAQQNRILVEKGLANSAVKVEKETKKTAKQMKQLSSDTGASTSATLELGRVFSDMPYGIRGVANNIQQLASNLFFMSKKTDEATGKTVGFRGAVGSLLKNLAGPAGILVAFQAGIALLDFFKVGMGKAEKETEKGTKAINAQVTSLQKLLNLKKSIENLLFSETDSIVLNKYSEGLLSLDETVKIISRNYGDFSNAYSKLTDEQKKDKENVKALLEGYQEMLSLKEKEKKQINKIQLLKIDVDKQERAAALRKAQGYKDGLITISQERKQLDLLEGDYIKTQKRLIKLEEYFSKEREEKDGSKVKKISPFKTPKELELDVKSNEDAILKFNNKIAQEKLKIELNDKLAAARTEEEKDNIRKDYAVKGLLIQIDTERKTLELKKKTEEEIAIAKTKSHREDLKRAYELYRFKIENDPDLKDRPKKRKELLTKAKDTYGIADKQAEDEGVITVEGIKDRYKPIFSLFNELSIERVKALWGTLDKDDKKIETDLAKLERYAKKAKEILNGIGDFVDAEYQRELSIEQNKTNVLNNELNKRLLNENLSKEQRKTIQNEIAQNDETLRKKQESIEKKRFKAQKAINIATALIDTGVAAVKALKNNGGVPTGLPAMFGTIALGLAQVATIARTKFQSSAGSSPVFAGGGGSSSGGGTGRAEASFNIVGGRTKEDALLGAIQAKFDQPVRAYVVSGDVTNQQQLDRVIVSSSSL